MANNELEAIRAGRRNPTNEGTANAARIIGIISTVLFAIGIVVLILALITGLAMVPWSDEFWREEFWREFR
jgi:cytochrome b subunit of formate dehydrogenase